MEGVLHTVLYGLGLAAIWLLCLGGVAVSAVGLSGTWLIVAAAALGMAVETGGFPGIWTVVAFAAVSAAVEGIEMVAGAWGVSRRGGSKMAGVAAVAGGLLGLLLGGLIPVPVLGSLLGMIVGSFALVFAVEHRRLKKADRAASIAWGTVLARVLVILIKVTVTFALALILLIGLLK